MKPRISIVIPAYNEEKRIESCLIQLRMQKFDSYEIIVVDNNSTDKTREIAQKYADVIINEKIRGCSSARQKGFKFASAEIIATTDADTIVDLMWLDRIFTVFKSNPNAIAIYGPVKYIGRGRTVDAAFSFFTYYFMKMHQLLGCPYLFGCNFAITKDLFYKTGGFNVNMSTASDLDFSLRIKKQGPIVFDKLLIVESSARNLGFNYNMTRYISMLLFRKSMARRDVR